MYCTHCNRGGSLALIGARDWQIAGGVTAMVILDFFFILPDLLFHFVQRRVERGNHIVSRVVGDEIVLMLGSTRISTRTRPFSNETVTLIAVTRSKNVRSFSDFRVMYSC